MIKYKRLTQANVGWQKSPADIIRNIEVLHYLVKNGFDADKGVLHDDIDLNYGRDFLTENKEYDIVVLHYIFNGNPYFDLSQKGFFKTSSKHDVENWKIRLLNTKAKLIFAYGTSTEVGLEYIGTIPGYKIDFVTRGVVYIHENR